jgi:hypothetical protein
VAMPKFSFRSTARKLFSFIKWTLQAPTLLHPRLLIGY